MPKGRATRKTAMIVPPMARPAGEAGVSMISNAAGRNSSSSRRRRPVPAAARPMASSDDFMKTGLGTMENGIAPTLADQLVVTAVLDDVAVLDGDDAIGVPYGGEAVGVDEDGSTGADPAHVLLDNSLGLIVERTRCPIPDQDARTGGGRPRDGKALTLARQG